MKIVEMNCVDTADILQQMFIGVLCVCAVTDVRMHPRCIIRCGNVDATMSCCVFGRVGDQHG